MGIKFNANFSFTLGSSPCQILSIYKVAAPYRVKLLRFWLMCIDPTYPPGEMIGLEIWRYSGVSAEGSGGTLLNGTTGLAMAQDNSLALSPFSTVRANDSVQPTASAYKQIWSGGCQVWQGLDVILTGEPSIIGYTGYGPGLDAFALILDDALGTSVKVNAGMTFEEEY